MMSNNAEAIEAADTTAVSGEMELATLGATALAPDESVEELITREQRRSRRKRAVRARTISVKRMTKRELEIGRLLYPEIEYWKPRAREECLDGPRPCPFVSCKHHLFIDVSPRTGAIKLNFPDLEVWDMGESCALDVADRGGTTLEDVGAIMNLTRERIRQVEVKALARLEALRDMEALREYVDEGPVGKRRLPTLAKAEAGQDGGRRERGREETKTTTTRKKSKPTDEDSVDHRPPRRLGVPRVECAPPPPLSLLMRHRGSPRWLRRCQDALERQGPRAPRWCLEGDAPRRLRSRASVPPLPRASRARAALAWRPSAGLAAPWRLNEAGAAEGRGAERPSCCGRRRTQPRSEPPALAGSFRRGPSGSARRANGGRAGAGRGAAIPDRSACRAAERSRRPSRCRAARGLRRRRARRGRGGRRSRWRGRPRTSFRGTWRGT